jgi:hypothetical protein
MSVSVNAAVAPRGRNSALLEFLAGVAIACVLAIVIYAGCAGHRASRAYLATEKLMTQASTALEDNLKRDRKTLGPVPGASLVGDGRLEDPALRRLFGAMEVPGSVRLDVRFNPDCASPDCESAFIRISHCAAAEHVQLIRFGDGSSVLLPHLPGGGC